MLWLERDGRRSRLDRSLGATEKEDPATERSVMML